MSERKVSTLRQLIEKEYDLQQLSDGRAKTLLSPAATKEIEERLRDRMGVEVSIDPSVVPVLDVVAKSVYTFILQGAGEVADKRIKSSQSSREPKSVIGEDIVEAVRGLSELRSVRSLYGLPESTQQRSNHLLVDPAEETNYLFEG